MSHHSAGARLRAAMQLEKPLQLPGVINAYAALQAEDAGFKALYVSGAGIATQRKEIREMKTLIQDLERK